MVHLKISQWKFGDSELGNHHFEVKLWGVCPPKRKVQMNSGPRRCYQKGGHSLQTLTTVMASQPTPGPRTTLTERRPYDQGL